MEAKENRGLLNKKDYEDQLIDFCLFNFGALSLFSLSQTLGHLEFLDPLLEECAILGVLDQEGKGRVGKCKRT